MSRISNANEEKLGPFIFKLNKAHLSVFSVTELASPVLPMVKDFHQGYKELQSNQSLHTRFYLFPSSIDNIWL